MLKSSNYLVVWGLYTIFAVQLEIKQLTTNDYGQENFRIRF